MSKKGGGDSGTPTTSQTVTSTSAPWSGQQPICRSVFSRPRTLQPRRSAILSRCHHGAGFRRRRLGRSACRAQRALRGSPLNAAAQAGALGTAQGDVSQRRQPLSAEHVSARSQIP